MQPSKDIDVDVFPEVYRPSDDTHLILDLISLEGDEEILEIGCGSGFISLHCSARGCSVTAVDKDPKAVENTVRNAEKNGLDLTVLRSDLFSDVEGVWDVIVFNPPYLPKHPELDKDDRWDGGEKGNEVLIEFLELAPEYLNQGGRIFTCYSDMAPLEEVRKIIDEGFTLVRKKEERYRFESLYAVELKADR